MMTWAGFAQCVLFFLAGAWTYARGTKQGSPLPLGEAVAKINEFVQQRRQEKSNGNRPTLPRVGA